MAEQLTELDIAYADSPLNAAGSHSHGGLAPGERQRATCRSAQATRRALRSSPTPPTPTPTPTPNSSSPAFRKCSKPARGRPRKPGAVTLVRPDGYVAFSGDTAGYAQADAYMTKLMFAKE